MASLNSLPLEILGMIFKNSDRIETLSSAILVCRRLCASFRTASCVPEVVLYRQIPPTVLPYAIAWEEARCLHPDPVDTSIMAVIDQINNQPDLLIARAFKFPMARLIKMSRTHDRMHGFVMDYAKQARALIDPESVGDAVVLTSTEYTRFCRAFYRVDLCNLLLELFGSGPAIDPSLLHAYFPWENEQVASALEYLRDSFIRATYEAMAHDVELGARTFEVSERLENRMMLFNHAWPIYHSKAKSITEMVFSLEQYGSYEATSRTLESVRLGPAVIWGDGPNLERGLCRAAALSLVEAFVNPSSWPPHAGQLRIRNVLEKTLFQHILTACTWTEDGRRLRTPTTADAAGPADKDSFLVWRKAHAEHTIPDTMLTIRSTRDGWLRRRAYLFWDEERVQLTMGKNPGSGRFTVPQTIPDESWKERARIWKHGGSGYWSEGGMSGVVWGGPDRAIPFI
ncbi:uncharacterized protein C8A04DRAFT_30861 [Dichotomopilus funicola]|uniref:F-box domain-containing protein n=1 Tax=Dichotomopilus funicola TaxID=1934379 RepID=A0AAN6UYL1_9PEZI|nr:hypothetical protein C8A04DRAFT_30861 [Dichotomopilus funicola]